MIMIYLILPIFAFWVSIIAAFMSYHIFMSMDLFGGFFLAVAGLIGSVIAPFIYWGLFLLARKISKRSIDTRVHMLLIGLMLICLNSALLFGGLHYILTQWLGL